MIATVRRWLDHPIARHPMVRKITGYSAGSVVAIVVSEAAFAATLGWGHAGTTIASAAGFVGGAVPNYILNRRWAWRDRTGRDKRTEIVLYMTVALASFVVSAVVTHWAEGAARHLTADRGGQVALTTGAYLAVSGVFFVVKFVIYETVVFTRHPDLRVAVGTEVGVASAGPGEDSPEPEATEPSAVTVPITRSPEPGTVESLYG